MAINSATQWYYGADGQIYPAENNGDGAEFPMAPVGEDGREVKLVQDPALIKQRTVQMLGYDPDDKQVNPDGSVSVFNPKTGQYEQGVITASGQSMPLSLAREQGEQILQAMVNPKDESSWDRFKEVASGPGSVLSMPFTAGLGASVGSALGTSSAVGSGIVGAGKALLTGGNPLLGGAMGYGGSLLGGAMGGPQGSVADGMGDTQVAGYNVEWDGQGAFDDAAMGQSFLDAGGQYPSGVGPGGNMYTAGNGPIDWNGQGAADDAAMGQDFLDTGGVYPAGTGLGGNSYEPGAGGLTGANALKYGLPLAGALAGSGILGGGNSPAGNTTTTQDIPEWQKPYVMGLLNSAQQTYQGQQGNQMPGQLNQAGGQNMLNTIRGDYLSPDSNPYLQATYDKAARGVTDQYNYSTMPQLSRAFGNQQAFGGSSAFGEAFGKANQGLATGLADLGTGIFGGNYQSERGRQFSAAGAAPDYSSAMQTSPYAGIQAYGNIVGKGFGSQTQQPYFQNPAGGAMSGLLGGYALSNLFGK